MTPRRIVGVEKNYDWGDEVTIRHYFGDPSTRGTKIAELWWGTHPLGPSRVGPSPGQPLADVTGEMTMLVKLLACAQPLSLQTHPTKEQARAGFAREEALGIPRDAPHRMYRDDSDKPEMIVAISHFEALCGFAPVDDSVELLKSMGWKTEASILSTRGIAGYVAWALQTRKRLRFRRAPEWLQRIHKLHKGDPALRVAPLLNHVVLTPGQALSLPAGNLHAYLHGFGLEVMNSSDNVIRAGFTTKHVDVDELLKIVDTTPLPNPIVEIAVDGTYPSPSPAFSVGDLRTLNHHPDCHRVVCGYLADWDNSAQTVRHPEVVLVEAGTRAEFPNGSALVCTQH